MTVEEFLAWERRQELRYEFDGVQPIAMTGGTVARTVIASNLWRALDDRLLPELGIELPMAEIYRRVSVGG